MNILQIGDSHSVLAYGVELNRLLRSVPGATVTAFASSGSSPASWLSGYVARTTAVPPFLMIRPDGSEDLVPPGKERPTPNLGALVGTLGPDLVVVSLGANQRWQSPAQLAHDVAAFAQVTTKIVNGRRSQLVWVGPPPQKSDVPSRAAYDTFQEQLGDAVRPYGTFIPSGAFVPRYSGKDGLHYDTPEGELLARDWARGVFGQLVVQSRGSSASPASTADGAAARARASGGPGAMALSPNARMMLGAGIGGLVAGPFGWVGIAVGAMLGALLAKRTE